MVHRTQISARVAIALSAGLLLASLAPAATGAETAIIFSGEKPMDPITVDWVRVNGALAIGSNLAERGATVEFVVKNQPKSLTFDGVNSRLELGDHVRMSGFDGRWDATMGNLKFSGKAESWCFVNRDHDGDGLTGCQELAYGTRRDVWDTDGGGTSDGYEVARGTNPVDPRDDFFVALWTEDSPMGARNADIPIAWLEHNGARVNGHANLSGALGAITFDVKGEQWLSVNGTDMKVFEGDVVQLSDFNGTISRFYEEGNDDRLRLDGVASRVFISPDVEGTVVHTYGRIATHDNDTLTVDVYKEVGGQLVVEQSQTFVFPPDSLPPLYTLFDVYKFEDQLTETGSFQITVEAGEYQGQTVYWVRIFNADPVLISQGIPVPGSPVKRICAQAPEAPTVC